MIAILLSVFTLVNHMFYFIFATEIEYPNLWKNYVLYSNMIDP